MIIEFSYEQRKKANACNTVEELIALAKENGMDMTEAEATNHFAKLNPENSELSDNELETISGGCGEVPPRCPRCKSPNVSTNDGGMVGRVEFQSFSAYRCDDCYCTFDGNGNTGNEWAPLE